MTTNPPGDPAAAGTDPGPGPYDGPRVSREQVKDLGRLRRSSTDRKVAGVAAGVARHLDIDPLVVRIAFVVLAFFGGGGLLLYGVCWLFVPDEATGDAVVDVDERSRTVVLALAGVLAAVSAVGDGFGGWGLPFPVLLVIGVAVLLYVLRDHAPKPHPGPLPGPLPTDRQGPTYTGYQPPARKPSNPLKRGPILFWFTLALAAVGVGVVLMLHLAGVDVPVAAYPATVLAACGLMLVVGAFYGRGGGLIAVGLLASVATVVAAVVPDVDAGAVHRTPTTAAALEDGYRLGVGELKIDLTELSAAELAKLDDEALDLDLNIGRIELIVPADGLSVEAEATVEAGEVRVFGERASDTLTLRHDGGEDTPELTVDADLTLGEIQIHTARSNR